MTKPAEQIILNDIEIQIVRSKRRRTSQIEIKNKQVLVRAPHYLPQFFIRKFIKQKRHWIIQQLTKQKLQPEAIEKQFKDGEVFFLFNRPFVLRLAAAQTGSVNFTNDQLLIHIPKKVKNQRQYIRNKMINWYKQAALSYIQKRANILSNHQNNYENINPKSIKVREYKRRWGSCSSKGELSFNWRIIMAPEIAIDYVIIHEVAHLKEFNHSKKFWHLVQQAMPDYKQQKIWFKTHAGLLNF